MGAKKTMKPKARGSGPRDDVETETTEASAATQMEEEEAVKTVLLN